MNYRTNEKRLLNISNKPNYFLKAKEKSPLGDVHTNKETNFSDFNASVGLIECIHLIKKKNCLSKQG